MRKTGRRESHVDIRVISLILELARSNFENERIAWRAILQVVPVFHARLEPRAIAGTKQFLTRIRHQHRLALDDKDELIFGRMPMSLARPSTWRQPQQVHPKIG